MWGCKPHWFALPKPIRDEIWRTNRPGQEISKTPSPDYLTAARAARDWIMAQAKAPAARPAPVDDRPQDLPHGWEATAMAEIPPLDSLPAWAEWVCFNGFRFGLLERRDPAAYQRVRTAHLARLQQVWPARAEPSA